MNRNFIGSVVTIYGCRRLCLTVLFFIDVTVHFSK